jgi:hypothetical protein
MVSTHGQNKLGLQFKGPAEEIEECRAAIARIVGWQITGRRDMTQHLTVSLMQRRIAWLEEKQGEDQ